MSEQKFKIKKKGNFFVAFDIEKKDVSYGRINIKTGQCIGGTLCFTALREHLESVKPKVKRVTYKVWMVVEELTEFEDGTEEFKDIEDHVRSVGRFDTIDEAHNQMNEVADQYEGDFTTTKD